MFGCIRITFTLFALSFLFIGLFRSDLSIIFAGIIIVMVAILFNNRYSKQGLMQRQTSAMEKLARRDNEVRK